MSVLPAVLAASLLLALPLTLLVSALVAVRYRSSTLRLMRLGPPLGPVLALGVSPVPPPPSGPLASPPADRAIPAAGGAALGDLHRRELRLWASLALLSLVVAFTANGLYLAVNGLEILPLRFLISGLVNGTPGLVLLMQLQRWPLLRQLAALALWLLLLLALYGLAATDAGLIGQALVWILPGLLWPWAVFGLLFGVPWLRAIAPFLVLPVFLLVLLVQLGLQLLARWVAGGFDGALGRLVGVLGVGFTILLFSLLPLVLGGLPLAHRFTRWLGGLYRRRMISELSYLFGSAWLLILLVQFGLPGWTAAASRGQPDAAAALVPLLAWLWIPLFFVAAGRRWLRPPARPGTPVEAGRPPALLVLRTFRRPGPVGWLFDHVVQRWRLLGPVLLITAADLASRTLEPHELVDFLEGRLQRRYVADELELGRQLDAVEYGPDHDGRCRVSEFRCFDTTWKPTLEALLARASLVLMDLRGFSAANAGCRHELGRIGEAGHLAGVVVLVDGDTDRSLAEAVLHAAGDPPPVQWIEARGRRLAAEVDVIAALTGGLAGRP